MSGFVLDGIIKRILEEYQSSKDFDFGGKLFKPISSELLEELRQYKMNETQSTINSVECPECGGEMVRRKGQYGTFWGCKNYPQCKGTRDSMGRSKAEREAEKEDRKNERSKREWTVE